MGVKQASDSVASKGSDASGKADKAAQHADNADSFNKMQPPTDKMNETVQKTVPPALGAIETAFQTALHARNLARTARIANDIPALTLAQTMVGGALASAQAAMAEVKKAKGMVDGTKASVGNATAAAKAGSDQANSKAKSASETAEASEAGAKGQAGAAGEVERGNTGGEWSQADKAVPADSRAEGR